MKFHIKIFKNPCEEVYLNKAARLFNENNLKIERFYRYNSFSVENYIYLFLLQLEKECLQ